MRKQVIFLLSMISIFFSNAVLPGWGEPGAPEENPVYRIVDGTIVSLREKKTGVLEVRGYVLQLAQSGNLLYYISLEPGENEDEEKPLAENIGENKEGPAATKAEVVPGEPDKKLPKGELRIGTISLNDPEKVYGKKLFESKGDSYLKRFILHDGICYLLFAPLENSGFTAMLYRFDGNNREIKTRERVMDIALAGERPLLLENRGESAFLHYNGSEIPLTIPGAGAITGVFDQRMVFVSNGSATEVVDILSGKSICQYLPGTEYEEPREHNLIIELVDELEEVKTPDTENMIFYNVDIDAALSGRTQTGLAAVLKEYRVLVEPGRYHIVKIERMELNRAQNRYVRLNNVFQPKSFRLYVPENRVIRISIKYDGKSYTLRQSVANREIKKEGRDE